MNDSGLKAIVRGGNVNDRFVHKFPDMVVVRQRGRFREYRRMTTSSLWRLYLVARGAEKVLLYPSGWSARF